ncbi:CNNM domain-containing protein [Magnetofaba australis]|uniref:Uncharacterized protein n=1 Tax=Magnetofaba australis IT-1 TaxID=1434232 RepID=A0A1Y2K218_9PROT|nr:CNNM domain-containing protein [Magnetofaba australis]OSM02002.1 hypothetical protein MAIT1_02075 [Magnetofaba australis IT-1]
MDPAAISMDFDPRNLELTLRIAIQVVLLLMSGLFSGSETALFSLSRMHLQKLRQSRHPRSDTIHEMLDEPRRLIISILCGNEIINIASAANMASILLLFFTEEEAGWLNIVVMVPLLLLVGEVTPKTFAVSSPVTFSTKVSARLLPRWMIFITPLREAIRFVADRLTTLIVGEAVKEENILKRDVLRTLVDESAESGVIEATERILIDNVLEAAETEIYEIMTPRTRLRTLNADEPLPKLIKKFRKHRHPRMPVVRGHSDNILGMLHSEDVLRLIRTGANLEELRIEDLIKPAHFVPTTKKVDEMFDYFQAHRTRAAIILGEFGGVAGIVTMKDVLTFIFGELTGGGGDASRYRQKGRNAFKVPGDMRLSEFDNLTNFGIDDPIMTTIGGVAFRHFDRLPKVGDSLVNEGYRFTVLEMDGLRIKTLQVAPADSDDSDEEEENAPIEASVRSVEEAQEAAIAQQQAEEAAALQEEVAIAQTAEPEPLHIEPPVVETQTPVAMQEPTETVEAEPSPNAETPAQEQVTEVGVVDQAPADAAPSTTPEKSPPSTKTIEKSDKSDAIAKVSDNKPKSADKGQDKQAGDAAEKPANKDNDAKNEVISAPKKSDKKTDSPSDKGAGTKSGDKGAGTKSGDKGAGTKSSSKGGRTKSGDAKHKTKHKSVDSVTSDGSNKGKQKEG